MCRWTIWSAEAKVNNSQWNDIKESETFGWTVT